MLKRMEPVDSAHQIGLATLLIDVLTVDEGVSRWRFKNRQIGHVVHYSATTRAHAFKRITELKSARQIGVSTISIDVLTVDEGVSGWRLKNRQIGHVVHYSSTTRPRASKRRMALKSARQIGVSTISKDVLTVDEGVCGWIFKNREIGHVFDYNSTTRARTSKQTTALESAH